MELIAVRRVVLLARERAGSSVGTNGQVSQWGGMQAGVPPRTR